ncbi:HNH endonuclease [Streptomyces sp. NPDC002491]
MTPARLTPPTEGRLTVVGRTMAGYRPSVVRSVPRPMYTTPVLRPPEPPLSPSRRDVLRRWEDADDYSCAYCDASFTETVAAEVDHIRPIAKGGVHEWFNLAPACSACNRAKSDRDVSDWLSETAGENFTDAVEVVTERHRRVV